MMFLRSLISVFGVLIGIYSFNIISSAGASEFKTEVAQLRTESYNSFIERQMNSLMPYVPQIRLIVIGGNCPEGSNSKTGCLAVNVVSREKIEKCFSEFCISVKNSIIHVRNEGIFVDEMYLIAIGYNSIVSNFALNQSMFIGEMPLDKDFNESDKIRLLQVNRNTHLLAKHLNLQRIRNGDVTDINTSFRYFVENWTKLDENFRSVINLGYAMPFLHEIGHWSEGEGGYFEIDVQGAMRAVFSIFPNKRRDSEISADKFAFGVLGQIVNDKKAQLRPTFVFDSVASFPVTFLAPYRDFISGLAGFPYSDFAFSNLYKTKAIVADCKENESHGKIRGKINYLSDVLEDGVYAFTNDEFEKLEEYVNRSLSSSHPSYLERALEFSKIPSVARIFEEIVSNDAKAGLDVILPIGLEKELFSLSEKKEKFPSLVGFSEPRKTSKLDQAFDLATGLKAKLFDDDVGVSVAKSRICKSKHCLIISYLNQDQRLRMEVYFEDAGWVALRLYGDQLRADMDNESMEDTTRKLIIRIYFSELIAKITGHNDPSEILMAWSNQIVKENECDAWTENLASQNLSISMTTPDIYGTIKILALPQ